MVKVICRTLVLVIWTLICRACRSSLTAFHCQDACKLRVSWDSSGASTDTASPGRNVRGSGLPDGGGVCNIAGAGGGGVAGGRCWAGSWSGETPSWRAGSLPEAGGNLKHGSVIKSVLATAMGMI